MRHFGAAPMKFRFLALSVLTGVGLNWSVRLVAQDVTVGEPVWFSNEPVPDELPKAKGRLRPTYPAELKKTAEIGYVFIIRSLDENGQSNSLQALGTHLPFQRAVEEEFSEWKMSPAKRGGKPVEARVRVPVIFNPKAAAPDGPEATPRLVTVTPVFTPEPLTRGQGAPTVRCAVSLDEKGVVTAVQPERKLSEKNLTAIRAAVASWRFAPARKGGQAVAAEMVVTVLGETKEKPAQVNQKPPRVTDQRRPVYPFAMRRFGLTGQVIVDFIVDAAGKVQNPTVFSSDNPAFDEPAIAAVREWKFKPGTRDDKPVSIHMQVPVVFTLDGLEGSDAYRIERETDQSKLPPALRYDTSPKIRGVLVPVYPYALRRDNVSGKAKVVMLINPQGRISDVKVLAADRPEFGRALAAALEGFRFDPALKDGKPVPHMMAFEQTFNFVELPDYEGDRLLGWEKKKSDQIVTSSALDAPPKPVSRRSPIFPVTVPEAVTKGEALIECLIDKEGRVRLPRVVSATEEGFGYAAVQAVSAWWFEPPLMGGKPVVVRVQIPFKFGETPKNTKAPASKAGAAKQE